MRTFAFLVGSVAWLFPLVSFAAPPPVPEIPAKVAELKAQSQDERYRYITTLQKRHSESKDLSILANLRDFTFAARKMGEELGLSEESDYDYVSILNLMDTALIGLSFHSPVNGSSLAEWYRRSHASQTRFKILHHWHFKVDRLERMDVLNELITFADAAKRFSDETERGEAREYIPRKAADLLEDASARLLVLNPSFEGVFDISFRCETPGACSQLPGKARMTVVNTRVEAKITTSFVDAEGRGVHYFDFTHTTVEKGGTTLRSSTSLRPQTTGEFALHVNTATGEVSGWIQDSRSAAFVLVEGKRAWTPAVYSSDKGVPRLLPVSQVPGVYEGKLRGVTGAEIPAQLVVKRTYGPKQGLVAGIHSLYREVFRIVEYNERFGVLHLVAVQPKSLFARWTLAYREDVDGKPRWTGFGYSTRSGALFRLSFTKTGEVTQPPKE